MLLFFVVVVLGKRRNNCIVGNLFICTVCLGCTQICYERKRKEMLRATTRTPRLQPVQKASSTPCLYNRCQTLDCTFWCRILFVQKAEVLFDNSHFVLCNLFIWTCNKSAYASVRMQQTEQLHNFPFHSPRVLWPDPVWLRNQSLAVSCLLCSGQAACSVLPFLLCRRQRTVLQETLCMLQWFLRTNLLLFSLWCLITLFISLK